MVGNYRQQNPRWPVGLCSALFPIRHCSGSEPESRRKPGLAESKLLAYGSNVDYGQAFNADRGDANRDVPPIRPSDRLLHALEESAAGARVPLGRGFLR